jgi:hypothetical protein
VSIGCGQELPTAASNTKAGPLGLGAYSGALSAMLSLVTDVDIVHEMVARLVGQQKRSSGAKAMQYYRLNPYIGGMTFGTSTFGGDADHLKTLRRLARAYLRREKASEWAALVASLRGRGAGGGGDDDDGSLIAVLGEIDGPSAPPGAAGSVAVVRGRGAGVRGMRKAAARATGMSGFWSGKRRAG